MSAIENNQAAWLTAATTKPLKIGPGPDHTKLEADEVLIQVAAVAINPSEWKVSRCSTDSRGEHLNLTILKFQDFAYLPVDYPHVLGSDAAGTVVQVGSGITRFKTGDRVIG